MTASARDPLAYVATELVLLEVLAERVNQENRCLEARRVGLDSNSVAAGVMTPEQCLAVLVEEVGEVARELCEARAEQREPSPNLRAELLQVAAVAVAWTEGLS